MIPTHGIRLPGSLCIFLFDLSQETGTLRLRAKDDQDRLEGDIPADGFFAYAADLRLGALSQVPGFFLYGPFAFGRMS